jgi:hypothetical protein
MPLLSAGGVCCAVLFEDEAGLLAGAGVAAGLPAGAADWLLAAGAGVDLLAGAELAAGAVAGAAAVESAAVALFELLFVVVAAAPLVSVVLVLFGAELSAASAEALFFDRDFFVVVALSDALVFAVESAEGALLAVELSGASAAVLLFLERLFSLVAAELSDAAASVLAAAFFLDLEVLVSVESAVASWLVCEASEAAAFFFAFFLLVELVSAWSVEPDEPDCCAARTVTLPKISSMATPRANRTPLLDLIWLSPPARDYRADLSTLIHFA